MDGGKAAKKKTIKAFAILAVAGLEPALSVSQLASPVYLYLPEDSGFTMTTWKDGLTLYPTDCVYDNHNSLR